MKTYKIIIEYTTSNDTEEKDPRTFDWHYVIGDVLKLEPVQESLRVLVTTSKEEN